MRKSLGILLLLAAFAFYSNPTYIDFENKANELFHKELTQAAAKGNWGAKVAQFLGAQKLGALVLTIDREDYYLFSVATVTSNLNGQTMGYMLGVFGKVIPLQISAEALKAKE